MRFLLAAALLVPAIAVADPTPSRTPDARQMHTDDCARARKANRTCVIDMGKSEDVVGNSPTSSGVSVGVIQPGKQPSLIRLRKEFIVEILKTTEDLD
jgi:hypothetical protein